MENARFIEVLHNGVPIHKESEAPGRWRFRRHGRIRLCCRGIMVRCRSAGCMCATWTGRCARSAASRLTIIQHSAGALDLRTVLGSAANFAAGRVDRMRSPARRRGVISGSFFPARADWSSTAPRGSRGGSGFFVRCGRHVRTGLWVTAAEGSTVCRPPQCRAVEPAATTKNATKYILLRHTFATPQFPRRSLHQGQPHPALRCARPRHRPERGSRPRQPRPRRTMVGLLDGALLAAACPDRAFPGLRRGGSPFFTTERGHIRQRETTLLFDEGAFQIHA